MTEPSSSPKVQTVVGCGLLALGIAVYRRFILKTPRLSTNGRDHYAIIILSVIMISGVFLGATNSRKVNLQ